MDSTPVVWLDEERLADVAPVLDALDVRYQSMLSGAAPALILAADSAPCPDPGDALHVLVVDAPTPVPCDFQWIRPLRPELLRLLLARATAGAGERRRASRSAIGAPIVLRANGDERDAILAQASDTGCALIVSGPLVTGLAIELDITDPPPDADRRLRVRGTVLGSRDAVTGDGATCDVSVRFEPLDASSLRTLREMLAAQGVALDASPSADAPARKPRVVLGRAVSRDALHLEHDPALRVGDACQVTLYAGSGEGPLRVRGYVTEAEPERGLRLRLDTISTEIACELERIAEGIRRAGSRASFVIAELEA